MELQALKDLVNHGEGQHLEFKKKASFPDKIVKEMVAFANSEGGHVLIGVDDDGKIAGLKFADEEKFVMEKAILDHARPRIRYKSELIPVTKKRAVLSYTIFESKRKPAYFTENPLQPGKAYIRLDDRSIQASRELKEILKRRNSKRGLKIQYGDKERILMKHLEAHDFITVRAYSKVAGIPQKVASGTLVYLVLANVLDVMADEKEDRFSINRVNYDKY